MRVFETRIFLFLFIYFSFFFFNFCVLSCRFFTLLLRFCRFSLMQHNYLFALGVATQFIYYKCFGSHTQTHTHGHAHTLKHVRNATHRALFLFRSPALQTYIDRIFIHDTFTIRINDLRARSHPWGREQWLRLPMLLLLLNFVCLSGDCGCGCGCGCCC